MRKKIVKITKRLISPLIASVLTYAVPAAAFAQTQVVPGSIRPIDNAVNVVRGIIQFILVAAFVAAFIFLLIGGIRWIMAGGDEKAVAGARGTITAALIGLVIVLVAYAIIRLVEIFFSVSIITGGVTIPTITTD
ncbi:MAG: hypothetical protein UT84_C0021G0007 [Candidatus Curtissbacteria bacterium GW2011_GWA1_40_16]|uniref:Integral membrane protein n=1 Tax=Candidatus Curtissbacteria bacterium GW2011_GWA1_40_16 TaxID=1618405 RepID=A0A0G0RIM9_9BACT|nr:MAG: hypothetical protein UT84_C0021G0007 [Candidatus Curtissbacteria bacterium GW2011_GWA1_40_16]